MPFDPDAYLASKSQTPAPQAGPSPAPAFDPDAYLASKSPGSILPAGVKQVIGAEQGEVRPDLQKTADVANARIGRLLGGLSQGYMGQEQAEADKKAGIWSPLREAGSIGTGYLVAEGLGGPIIEAGKGLIGPRLLALAERIKDIPFIGHAAKIGEGGVEGTVKGGVRGFIKNPDEDNSRAENTIKNAAMGAALGKAQAAGKDYLEKAKMGYGFLKDWLGSDAAQEVEKEVEQEAAPVMKTAIDPFTKKTMQVPVKPSSGVKAGIDPFTKKPL